MIASVENHFEYLLPSRLYEIVGWYENIFSEKFLNAPDDEWKRYREAVELSLRRGGIEPLFEITSSSASCYGFIFQYGNFDTLYELDAIKEDDDEGSNIKSKEFIRFLDYMILLMCRLHDENLEHQFDYINLSGNHQKEIESIKANYQDDDKLHELVDEEFEWIKDHWTEHQQNDERPGPEAQTVYEHYNFLLACLNMKASLKEEYTRVLMVNG